MVTHQLNEHARVCVCVCCCELVSFIRNEWTYYNRKEIEVPVTAQYQSEIRTDKYNDYLCFVQRLPEHKHR